METSMKEPKIHVGILFEPQIEFVFPTPYLFQGKEISGKQVATYDEGQILWNGRLYDELVFEPVNEVSDSFELLDVTIGINFHWERQEDQRFLGALKLIVEDGKLTGINIINVEDYLVSVISSEMKSSASLELLKAHTVISRSWLLAQMEKRKQLSANDNVFFSFIKKDGELIRWHDREDHTLFDVCADDHCQRYQGITRENSRNVIEAVRATKGQVLMSDDEICDARFSKCCGGVSEEYQYCWDDNKKPYLKAVRDDVNAEIPDLSNEAEAVKWIRSKPSSFCNTKDEKVLRQVLNDYDTETHDFYRWHIEYTQKELSALVNENLKMDFGLITDLVPLERGKSGRISKMKIIGTKMQYVIGKELEIRRALSTTHLYSSAFVVDKKDDKFIIIGAGWGHGVGLCQIGAAVMGEKGYTYNQILLHYYKNAEIKKIY